MATLHEECGIIGIESCEQAAQLSYYGLHAMQHRGEEGAGIVSCGHTMRLIKGEGLINDIFTLDRLQHLEGHAAIGHVRYSTSGGGGMVNVQPFLFHSHKGDMAVAHNGNIVNAQRLKTTLEDEGAIFQSTSDTEIIGHLIRRYKGTMKEKICYALNQLQGAFAFVILTKDALYGIRDRYGIRPLSLGQLPDGSYVIASETCAFDIIGASLIRDIQPGEVVCIQNHSMYSFSYNEDVSQNLCAMEFIYFSRPDSLLDHKNVHAMRKMAGKILFEESPTDADIVIGVPDSSISAAIGYAEASGIPYEMGLIKNKYTGRTFIQPTQELRDVGVKMKLSAIRSIVENQRVILIDDSIVRGTTSKRIIAMLKEAGARAVYVKIASPPLRYPCFYGVDISRQEELISYQMGLNDLCDYIGAEDLAFLSEKGFYRSLGFTGVPAVCMACFNGTYLTEIM